MVICAEYRQIDNEPPIHLSSPPKGVFCFIWHIVYLGTINHDVNQHLAFTRDRSRVYIIIYIGTVDRDTAFVSSPYDD